MELIVTEKDNAARRIADILSDGTASPEEAGAVTVYRWGTTQCVGLSGHVVGVDFPPEYSDWRDVEPHELVTADVEKTPTQEGIVTSLKRLARRADEVTIATDYDREGELIGKEAYELVREVNDDVPIKRVRFSSITDNEVTAAFAEPDDLDFDLAAAGEARQIIDLIWGAALTRFLSLSAGQLGDDFISVGRVQSPTLKLIVDREREIQAFDPEAYWELFAALRENGTSFEAQYFYYDEDDNEAERVWEESTAQAVHDALSNASSAVVESVRRRTRTDAPPEPFNTTQFIRAAGSLGYSAQRAMSIAEDLYTAGYITYPRTDNTVYPDDLDPEELLAAFEGHSMFGEDAEQLLESESIEPTEGDEETTDHPPIHPTGEWPDRTELGDDEWEVYELVVRRFFATVADPARWEHLKIVSGVDASDPVLPDGGDRIELKANGKRLLEPGYHEVYPYFSTSENHVPPVDEGQKLAIGDVRLEDKETQPPRRYGQSRLIETMEDAGLGTKCLTGDTTVLERSGDAVERTPIEELFDERAVVMNDGDTDIAVSEDGPTTVSFDEPTGAIESRDATLVSRRSLEDGERILDVETTAGSVSVTEDHPLYVATEDGIELRPAGSVSEGDDLLTARRDWTATVRTSEYPVAVSWDDFAGACDKNSKLYGTSANDALAEYRSETGQTQRELAAEVGADRSHISEFEHGKRDVPVWILGELDIRPNGLHGLNPDCVATNPFPLRWSPALARVIANFLGDGSIRVDDDENVVDVRYVNTDRRLVDRFVSDIETLFGVSPTVSERAGRETHHSKQYQVNVQTVVGRILKFLVGEFRSDSIEIPADLVPVFVGALFDDEGHVSQERKAFISNTDHELLERLQRQLDAEGIEATLAPSQHKLHVRGRRNLERFFDAVPISCDWKFYRMLDGLRSYDVTNRKANLLAEISERPRTTEELADGLDVSVSTVRATLRELKEDGLIETAIEGSNRSNGGNRTYRYTTDDFEDSIYATVCGVPSTTMVEDVSEREYDGPVYDLTVDEAAPNFAVEGGVVVHNSTRHNTLEKLYDRGYIEGDPPRPTELAMAVVEAAEEFADRVVSEEMTAELEADMTAIARGDKELDEVTDESREMLDRIFGELTESRDEVGEHLRESLKADKTLGPCPESDHELLIRRARGGSAFVGCDGYPDCEYTLPLPDTGKPLLLDETCEEHGLKHVKMLAGRKTFVHGCPQCAADEAGEGPIIGTCPDCGDTEGGELAIKQLRNGSRLVGCTRYPDCEYSLPLPRRGEIEVTDKRCEEHDLPELVVDNGDRWELGCPICNYREYQARESDSGTDLEALDGIGTKTAEKLQAAGIESIDALAEADPEVVADDVDGVSADRVRDWQAKA